jgi:hypothetical protein
MEGLPFLNAATLGLANNLSMSHNIGVLKDIINPDKSLMDVVNSQINGNNGVVSDEYAKEHPIKSNLINFGLDALSPGIIKGGNKAYKIARNIKHRNLIAFNSISPFTYDNQFERGKEYLKALYNTDELPTFNAREGKMPEWYHNNTLGSTNIPIDDDTSQFINIAKINRAQAWRKYLQIPDEMYGDTDIYSLNPDGKTWSYNKKALNNDSFFDENKGTIVALSSADDGIIPAIDFITGNGGNVNVELRSVLGSDGTPLYREGVMNDIFDVNPFSRKDVHPLSDIWMNKAAKYHNKFMDGIKDPYGKKSIVEKAVSRLENRTLNRWRNDPPKFIQKLDDRINSKLHNMEIGRLVGGKPFTLKHKFYFTDVPFYIPLLNKNMSILNKTMSIPNKIIPVLNKDYYTRNLYSNEESFPYFIDKLRGDYLNCNQYDYEKDFPNLSESSLLNKK